MHAAVKVVPNNPGADRELLIGANLDGRNIIPIIDKGEHDEHLVLVMPLADESLRERLDRGRPELHETLKILTDIATALTDIEDKVVHRDLKPENVLRLGDDWCITDFGISRFPKPVPPVILINFR